MSRATEGWLESTSLKVSVVGRLDQHPGEAGEMSHSSAGVAGDLPDQRQTGQLPPETSSLAGSDGSAEARAGLDQLLGRSQSLQRTGPYPGLPDE